MNDWLNSYYEQLVGAVIVGFKSEGDEFGCSDFPTFTLKMPNGAHLKMTVSCDEEGNDGGFLFIEEAA